MDKPTDALSLFHPLVARWFSEQVGEPTEIQGLSWPRIAAGEHALITAPTGSGKTLTAFLWSLNQWAVDAWSPGHTHVLYVSPLKALNNDIQRNLFTPLNELRRLFKQEGLAFPKIQVKTRSGDTPQTDRRAMLRRPPEILITTPESLNILLSSAGGRSILNGIQTVILDEIHEVLGTKRGVYLITAVDRLVPLSGEFQRIALSATMKPLEAAASFVGGYMLEGSTENPIYKPRPVKIVTSSVKKSYSIQVQYPDKALGLDESKSLWRPIAKRLKETISKNRSTLIFVNNRRLCERLTLMINEDEAQPIAYAHHGSLSREIRVMVENRLKAGELKAIVATNSLELGIDIGVLDEVVMVQSPPTVASAIQRVGRAGHQVGSVSRGTFCPTHSQDLLEAAVLARGILDQDMASIAPIECPLDVLAQTIVSMVGVEMWDIDALYARMKTSAPYHSLTRTHFDLVLKMLAGRFADTRIRELQPRISIDRLDNTITARKGALITLYMSGGVIPDRGYYKLRHSKTKALIGELDEEFVWEATVGDTFNLGTQNWHIETITHNDVFVRSAPPSAMSAPFWNGEVMGRNFHFSNRIGTFLEHADQRLNNPGLIQDLIQNHFMDNTSAEHLVGYLKDQKESLRCALPHRHHMVLEFVATGPGAVPGNQLVIHTLWGARVNRPYAMALDAAWEAKFGHRLQVFTGNDCIAILLPHDVGPEELLSLVTSHNVIDLLRERLEGSGFFGARFRECAGRALLLNRKSFNERLPLWINRLRSKKILESVLKYDDFPILLEAWRTCLKDSFDLESLVQLLAELETGKITWSEARTNYPSPMARTMSWRQIKEYMYAGDESATDKKSELRGDLLRDLALTPDLRPVITRDIVDQFEQKRQRLYPGYSPASIRDLVDWVKERLIIPLPEWKKLLEAMTRDHGGDIEEWIEEAGHKLVEAHPPKAANALILTLEDLPRISPMLYGAEEILLKILSSSDCPALPDADRGVISDDIGNGRFSTFLGEWLQFYGPVSPKEIQDTLGSESNRLEQALADLVESEDLCTGRLVSEGGDDDVCDRENFEHLLRLTRAQALPAFKPLDIEFLPLFLADHQAIGRTDEDMEGLGQVIEQLLCYPQPADRWEKEIFPARFQQYQPSWLDAVMNEGELRWIGAEKQQVAFCFETDLDLMQGEEAPESREKRSQSLLPDTLGRYDFSTLLRLTGLRPGPLSDQLWAGVWKGEITNDTFLALRRGIETRFKAPNAAGTQTARRRRGLRSASRGGFSRWKNTMPFTGNWFNMTAPSLEGDLLDREERNKDRVRLLLDRYGILFRELLLRESPPFQWSNLFRSMRLMEYSGEILGGYFFHGIPGPQFISHQAFRKLQQDLSEDTVWWINACDPVSPCGLYLDGLKGTLPKRVEGAHLVYQGKQLIMVSERKGKTLTFFIPPHDPVMPAALAPLHHMLERTFQPMRRITVEMINDGTAPGSPYVEALKIAFDITADYKRVVLYKKRHRI